MIAPNSSKCLGEIHIWISAGDPNYFPYEGMLCDCGLTHWEKPKNYDEQVKERQEKKNER